MWVLRAQVLVLFEYQTALGVFFDHQPGQTEKARQVHMPAVRNVLFAFYFHFDAVVIPEILRRNVGI
ncbi:hypothetical protein D3C87_2100110 [compost metagenome]